MSGARVLVAGLPRSGTTWVGEVLGRTAGARYLHEPDNHLLRPEAWWAKRRLGPYPELDPGDDAADYERLWALAFAGGPRPSLLYAGARVLQRAGAPRISGRLASRNRHGGRAAPGPLVVKSVTVSPPVTGPGCGPSDGPAPARVIGQPSIQSSRSRSIGRSLIPSVPPRYGSARSIAW